MATPIKETPILKGKDALRFLKLHDEMKHRRVSEAERNRIRMNFEKLNSISNATITLGSN